MAKAVADTIGENQGGFAYDTFKVSGFSHMHDSGTGGVCDVKNIKLRRLLTIGSLHHWEISLYLFNLPVQMMISISASGR